MTSVFDPDGRNPLGDDKTAPSLPENPDAEAPSPDEEPSLPDPHHELATRIIKIAPCKIGMFFGHHWRTDPKHRGTGFETIRLITAEDWSFRHCSRAGILTCWASMVPNRIPLTAEGYSDPSTKVVPKGHREDGKFPNYDDKGQELNAAAKSAAANICSDCCCDTVEAYVETYGLSWWDRTFGTFPIKGFTMDCWTGSIQE